MTLRSAKTLGKEMIMVEYIDPLVIDILVGDSNLVIYYFSLRTLASS